MPAIGKTPAPASGQARLRLENGSRVAVIGGGPAGSFFSFFLLQMARRRGLQLQVDVFEPRDFERRGPGSCNMCGGVISESLVQNLAGEGINLPSTLIQRRIDSYSLHMNVGSVRIPTPLQEKRIASVHRGSGPRTFEPLNSNSFDAFLLGQAVGAGARRIPERVDRVAWNDGRPEVRTKNGLPQTYDLLASAVGINTSSLQLVDLPDTAYAPPESTKAYISEFYLGQSMVKRYIGSSMHVFLLDLPRLAFAALIPKSDYVTVCLLGRDVGKELAQSFLNSSQVKECMPPLWRTPKSFCHCSPRISIRGAARPFGDRVVFIGDCGVTKLYKDGVGAAYRTSKAAALTAAFRGVSAEDFRRHYWPTCRAIHADNRIGKLIFAVTGRIQQSPYAQRAVWRMVSDEQSKSAGQRRMSLALWDVFTGSAPYRSVMLRALHPAFIGGFIRNLVAARRPLDRPKRVKGIHMAKGSTGAMGKRFKEGEVICQQGERGDCMYVIQKGKVEVIQRQGDKEFCLAELSDGDFFGEMALFEQQSRQATIRALTDVWVYTLERDSLLRRLHEDPSLAFKLIQQMSYRIRELESALIREVNTAS